MEGVLSGLAERRFVGNTGLRRLVTGVCRAEERGVRKFKTVNGANLHDCQLHSMRKHHSKIICDQSIGGRTGLDD